MTDSNNEAPIEPAGIDPLTGQKLAPAIPAATVIIFRDTVEGSAPELLMVERSSKMAFAAGAAVFPGGRIDPEDYEFATELGCGDDEGEGAARIAAIRETVEETGLAAGFVETPAAGDLVEARAALHAGKSLQHLCAKYDWTLDLNAVVPFARWRPPFAEARIFDTRFYLANAGAGRDKVLVDETENRRLFWASAQQVLDMADAGKMKIIFPTRRNLERLALFRDYDHAVAHAKQHSVTTITPYVEERSDGMHLCIPDDLGYPVLSEPIKKAMRG